MEIVKPDGSPPRASNLTGSIGASCPSQSSQDPPILDHAQNALSSELTDLSALTTKAQLSSPELRQEAINRAHALMEDPHWLSDNNLESLATKIAQEESL